MVVVFFMQTGRRMKLTVEEYFSKVTDQEKKISYQEDKIVRLRDKLTSISASTEGERVKSSGKKEPLAELYCLIDEEERKLKKLNQELDNILDEIRTELANALHNDTYEKVLYKRYCMHMTINQISKNLNYTWRWIMELKKKAYKELEEWLNSIQ